MVFGGLKNLFGGAPAAKPAHPTGPFAIGIGRAVQLDLMRLRLEEKRLARGMPTDMMVITGHGIADLGAGSLLHRYYDDSGNMLQVLCQDGISDDCVREITLYHPWDELVPASEGEWQGWAGRGGKIGSAHFEADGFRFERVWGELSTPWMEPAEFTETVTADEGPVKHVHQKLVPYRREIGTAMENLILAVERDLSSPDRGSVTFMIGYGLSRSDVTPV